MQNRGDEKADFEKAITKLVAKRLDASRSVYISDDNVLNYHHGDHWAYRSSDTAVEETESFVAHSAEATFPVQRIINHELSVLNEFVDQMSEQLHQQMASSVFEMVGQASEASGNVVAIHGGDQDDVRAAFKELAGRMQLGVTRYGAPSYPTLFVHPSNNRMIAFLKETPTRELQQEMDEINLQKELRATAEEAMRLGRFRR